MLTHIFIHFNRHILLRSYIAQGRSLQQARGLLILKSVAYIIIVPDDGLQAGIMNDFRLISLILSFWVSNSQTPITVLARKT